MPYPHTCPLKLHLRQRSSMFPAGQAMRLTSEPAGGPNRHSLLFVHSKHARVCDLFTGSVLSIFQKPSVGSTCAERPRCTGSEGFLQARGLLCILFPSFGTELPIHEQMWYCFRGWEGLLVLLGFFSLFFLSSQGRFPSVYEAWSNGICNSSS